MDQPQGRIAAYTTAAGATTHYVFRDREGRIWELWETATGWNGHCVSDLAGGVPAVSDPSAYITATDTQHIVYAGSNGKLHELRAGSTWLHHEIDV